ncbi:MAG: hypothetical protein J6034_07030 [Bacteroidaceae bacterium]|nr:hypothetical protein [Bacteroidaceae bacterium]
MEGDNFNYREMAQDARRTLDKERERLVERVDNLGAQLQLIDAAEEALEEISKLREENNELQQRNAELEMKLAEMSKLSAGVAKKASNEELLKALRIFVNNSKRKKLEKRTAVKEMVFELANANGIVFPYDLAATLDRLDDEVPQPNVVNVSGNYNDIHDNREVKIK